MIRMYVRQAVGDFETWRKDHEAKAAERAARGVSAEGVHRSLDDPNEVTYWHDFTTPEEARTYADGPGDSIEQGDRGSRIVWFGHAM